MGWVFILILALAVFAALWRFGRLDKGGLQFLAASLLLAFAGYAWQGHPRLAGSPRRPPEHRGVSDSEFVKIRHDLLGRFNNADSWLTLAEAYERDGDTLGGAQIIEAALKAHPNDPDLWVGLGNALVVHGGGMMNPAAQLAFDRAAALAPNHPGPKFFYGLALAQSGRIDEAEKVWRDLLATAPPNAMWRSAIEQRLQMIEQIRAMAAQASPPSQGGN
ncbi:MAG TPA: tetratricopeptide repeat protein [Allosphingosinicella sp.]|nr:tetratricopeptide repeat protein [Allosphingosinicella sp.]